MSASSEEDQSMDRVTVVFGNGGARKPGFVPKGTLRTAIALKCRDCIYDSCVSGTWRQQTEACDSQDCALWPHRPKSAKPKRVEEAAAA